MKRDPETNLIEGIEYPRLENGKINWRAMIPKEYLYINKQHKETLEKRLGKPFEQIQVDEVEDKYLICNMAGMQYILDIYGYYGVNMTVDACSESYAASTCSISFMNCDGEPARVFSASASAHNGNVHSWYKNYLLEASGNRARVRAIRLFLGISVVNAEELGNSVQVEESQQSAVDPKMEDLRNKIIRIMDEKEIPMSIIRSKFQLGPEVEKVNQIAEDRLFEICDRLTKYVKPDPKKTNTNNIAGAVK